MTNDEYNPLQQFHQTSPVACIERLVRVGEEFRLLSVVRWFWFSAEVTSLIPGSKMGMPLRAQQLMQLIVIADHLAQMIGVANSPLMLMEVAGLTRAIFGEKSALRLAHQSGCRDRTWRREPVRSNCVSPSYAGRATSQAFASGGGWRRRRNSLDPEGLCAGRPHSLGRGSGVGAMAWAESPGAG